jgi:hypothetical protein
MDHREDTATNNTSIAAFVFVAIGTRSQKSCLAMAISAGSIILAFRQLGGGGAQTNRQGDLVSLLLFYFSKQGELAKKCCGTK